ncbi:hypothetical protein ACWEPN_29760 [Nonomuraea wenchangensis]
MLTPVTDPQDPKTDWRRHETPEAIGLAGLIAIGVGLRIEAAIRDRSRP